MSKDNNDLDNLVCGEPMFNFLKKDEKVGSNDVNHCLEVPLTSSETDCVLPGNEDAGIRAANKIRERAAKAAKKTLRVIRFVMISIILLVLLTVGGFGYYSWVNKTVGFTGVSRECSTMVGDTVIKGSRSYSYKYYDILGFRYIDKSNITEKTTVEVKGSEMTVVGTSSEVVPSSFPGMEFFKKTEPKPPTWWSVWIGQGERGIQILKPADFYTFILDKNVNIVSYDSFCNY